MRASGFQRLLRLTAVTGSLVLISGLTACKKEEKAAAPDIRPVRTVTVEPSAAGETVSLTGEIQPRYQADIGFRVAGKIIERPVDVGTQVKKGDLLARLDPQQYRQDFEVAKAEVAAAEAEETRSEAQEWRQRELLKNGNTTRVQYDQALKTFKTAQAQLNSARARQVQASENLDYTELKADNDGVITTVGADPGQVVSAGQMVVRLAQPGEREAVFNVAEALLKNPPRKDPTVEVNLVSNPDIRTEGRVRYISPQADPTTRTYTVRVSLPGAPSYVELGREEDPSFSIKTMIVTTRWPGATIDDTMLQVTDRIEKKLQETPWLYYLKSSTKPGVSTIYVNVLDNTPKSEIPD